MKPNIFKSRKFWLAISAAVVNIGLLWGGQFLEPLYFDLLKGTIVAIDGVVAVLIAAIAYEDAAFMRSQ